MRRGSTITEGGPWPSHLRSRIWATSPRRSADHKMGSRHSIVPWRSMLVPGRPGMLAGSAPGCGHWASADAELAVARLVAQGLSNREVAERLFVSPHTVGAHLRHVFTKLSVSSRVEL